MGNFLPALFFPKTSAKGTLFYGGFSLPSCSRNTSATSTQFNRGVLPTLFFTKSQCHKYTVLLGVFSLPSCSRNTSATSTQFNRGVLPTLFFTKSQCHKYTVLLGVFSLPSCSQKYQCHRYTNHCKFSPEFRSCCQFGSCLHFCGGSIPITFKGTARPD
jgi:hypothetical protein